MNVTLTLLTVSAAWTNLVQPRYAHNCCCATRHCIIFLQRVEYFFFKKDFLKTIYAFRTSNNVTVISCGLTTSWALERYDVLVTRRLLRSFGWRVFNAIFVIVVRHDWVNVFLSARAPFRVKQWQGPRNRWRISSLNHRSDRDLFGDSVALKYDPENVPRGCSRGPVTLHMPRKNVLVEQ